jgi:outer membrane protein assembly factor BamB
MRRRRIAGLALVAVALVAGPAAGQGAPTSSASWTSANGDNAGRRAATATELDARTIPRLRVRWRFRVRSSGTGFGAITSNPVIRGDAVYFQDSDSSVYALDAGSGALRWKATFKAPNDGPNGVSISGSRVYGATDTTVFALDAATGRRLWSRRLVTRFEQFIAITPVVDRGRVYVSTQGVPPGGRGAVYALSAATGKVVWRFQSVLRPLAHPDASGGGGAWNPVSVDGRGDVYVGIANPSPWGGSKAHPNGSLFPGPVLYTDSLVVLDGASGRLLWYDQVTPHDVRDHDFQASPILATAGGRPSVFGAGKGGQVIAWDSATHARLWSRAVGIHRNDHGPLTVRPETVCPGLLGGVLTPMAYAAGRLFVPVVELCSRESAVTTANAFGRPPSQAKGTLDALDAATGKIVWQAPLGSAPFGCATVARDAVIVPTYDGRIVALAAADGRTLWRTRLRAGNNSCPAVGKDVLIVGAGAPNPGIAHPVTELVAYGLPG